MASKPLMLSVIMANYNYGPFIGQAIDSVLNQTYENYELVIVDYGSTDDSRDIISSYNDRRIKKIFRNNRGQSFAFSSGITKSAG